MINSSKSEHCRSISQFRLPRWVPAILLLVLLGSGTGLLAAPSPAIQARIEQIAGAPIATASTADIIRAINKLIAQDPKLASQIIETIGAADRKDDHCEISQFVRAAIVALGIDAKRLVILNLVQKAVVASPKCAPAIASAAIMVSPMNFADDIVEAAVAALPDPTIKIGDLTAAEAVARAGIAALAALQDPGQLPPVAAGPDGGGVSDAAGIFAAANRGFQSSLAALFNGALGTTTNNDFKQGTTTPTTATNTPPATVVPTSTEPEPASQ